MAVVEVKLKFGGIGGGDELSSGRRDHTQVWLARTDSATDGDKTVLAYPGLPQYGTFYKTTTESDPEAFLRKRNAKLVDADSSLIWEITYDFSTHADSGQGNQGNSVIPPPQPLDIPVIAEWDAHEEKEPAYFALDDNENQVPICNSAGDLFDPPPERITTIQVLRLQRNEADFDFLLAAKYSNAINSDSWLGFAPGMVLFKPPRSRFVSQRGVGYWETSYEFHINYRGWFSYRWDAGVREFLTIHDDATGQTQPKKGYYHIKNKDGTFATEPVLLNGKGERLIAPGDLMTLDIIHKQAVIFKYRVQPKLPFTPLGII